METTPIPMLPFEDDEKKQSYQEVEEHLTSLNPKFREKVVITQSISTKLLHVFNFESIKNNLNIFQYLEIITAQSTSFNINQDNNNYCSHTQRRKRKNKCSSYSFQRRKRNCKKIKNNHQRET